MNKTEFKIISQTPNSTIYCYGEQGHRMAIKMVNAQQPKLVAHLRNEYALLKRLRHRNIIQALKYQENIISKGNNNNSQSIKGQQEEIQKGQFDNKRKEEGIDKEHKENIENKDKENKENRKIMNSLVMQFAERGSLLDCLKKGEFNLKQMLNLFKDVSEALAFLHGKDICHRDVKLQNILVFDEGEENIAKLCDFGFASVCKKGKEEIMFGQFKGTRRGYMAPEIFGVKKDAASLYDGKKTDIFALGVILFSLVFKKLPFEEGNEENRLYKMLREQRYNQFWSEHKSQKIELELGNLQEFKRLFESMVQFDARARPGILQVTQNSWIKSMSRNTHKKDEQKQKEQVN